MQNSELIMKDCEIPAVPMVALKILRLVDDPRTDVNDVQEAIMADQSLASRVLRVANSSYYGASRKIDTISDAIVMMGFQTIKNLVLAVSTQNIYKKFGLLEKKLWDHSIGASVASAILAREVRYENIEEATVAGLLHDVGKVILNNNFPERFSMLTEAVYNERTTFAMKESLFFDFGHAEAGGLLASKWGFPKNLCEAIKRHHYFRTMNDLRDLPSEGKTLCVVTALADSLCVRLGIGYRGPAEDSMIMDREYRKLLNINDRRYAELIEIFNKAYIQEKLNYDV